MKWKIIFVIVVFMSCASVPGTHYYVLDYPIIKGEANPEPHDVIIGVLPFTADHEYQQSKIVYRPSPHEINFYNYHKWQDLPSRMVTEKMVEQLSASGYFKNVINYPDEIVPDYILKGGIKRFEEWDMPDGWYAKVHIEVQLFDPEDNSQIVWQGEGESEIKLYDKSVEEVVKGINEGLAGSIDKIIESLNYHFKQEQ